MKKRAQGFNTATQDSNPGSRNRESEALPLSHCALPNGTIAPTKWGGHHVSCVVCSSNVNVQDVRVHTMDVYRTDLS